MLTEPARVDACANARKTRSVNAFVGWPWMCHGRPMTRTRNRSTASSRSLSPNVTSVVGTLTAMCLASSNAYRSAPPTMPEGPKSAGIRCATFMAGLFHNLEFEVQEPCGEKPRPSLLILRWPSVGQPPDYFVEERWVEDHSRLSTMESS